MKSFESQNTVSAHEVNGRIQCSCFLPQSCTLQHDKEIFGTPRKNGLEIYELYKCFETNKYIFHVI